MPDIDQLHAAFVQAWQAGEAPDPEPYLDRAAPADQDELAERIETFLMLAPSVEPTAARAAEIRASPAFAAAAALASSPDALPWAVRLRRARERALLTPAELGARFAAAFGLQGREEKAATLLRELESEERPATGVTRRAGERLAELLGLATDALVPPARPPAQPLFRADLGAQDVRRLDPGTTGGTPPGFVEALDAAMDITDDWDALDDLLRGGDFDDE